MKLTWKYLLSKFIIIFPFHFQRRRSVEDEHMMRKYLKEGDLISAEVQKVYDDGSLSLYTRSLKYGKVIFNPVFSYAKSGQTVIVFSVYVYFLNVLKPSHSLILPSHSLAVQDSHGVMLHKLIDSCLMMCLCFHCCSVTFEPCNGLTHPPLNFFYCLNH